MPSTVKLIYLFILYVT